MKRAMNFGGSGLADWVLQRVTALVFGCYFVVVFAFFVSEPVVTFQSWQGFILSLPMRIFTILAVVSFVIHAWVGLWTVATDYLKILPIRIAFHIFYATVLMALLVWCVGIMLQS